MLNVMWKWKSLSCVWLFCNHMDDNPPGSSVHGILQARILEYVAISFSRGSSQPRDWIHVSCITGGFFTAEPAGKNTLFYLLRMLFLEEDLGRIFFWGNVDIGLNPPNLRREISACDYPTRSFHTCTLCIPGPIWMPLGQSISIPTVLPTGLESF